MLRVMMLRNKLKLLQKEESELRSKQIGFKKREDDLASQIEEAKTEEELSAVSAAVEELEASKKTVKERLQTIAEECAAAQQEIEEAEAAAEAAAGNSDPEPTEGGERSRTRSGAAFQKRCREFQRTGRMNYTSAIDMVRRAAVLSSSAGVIGPTGVGDITDPVGNHVSDFIDLIKTTDCTGMASYEVPYLDEDAQASDGAEGKVPNESEPTFGFVKLTPKIVNLISYISRQIRKQSPLQYEAKVNESVRRALRRILSQKAIAGVLASDLNSTMPLTGASGAALFTPNLLSDIILAYGGDEGVEGAATLVLNKHDLKAFAAVRGTNEFLPVYSITPDAGNPSGGVIKDNNGLSCRYCLNKNVAALSTATMTTTAKKFMFYGNPQCAEMGLWGGVDVTVNEGYKFGEGLLTILGEVLADTNVTVKNGFVVVTGKSA